MDFRLSTHGHQNFSLTAFGTLIIGQDTLLCLFKLTELTGTRRWRTSSESPVKCAWSKENTATDDFSMKNKKPNVYKHIWFLFLKHQPNLCVYAVEKSTERSAHAHKILIIWGYG